MTKYIIRRLLILVPTLLVTTFIIFVIVRMTPGDPLDLYESPDNPISTEERATLAAQYGLDKPFLVQYVLWVTRFFSGDLGKSFNWNQPVWDLIMVRLWPTVYLAGLSLLLAITIAIPIGTISALRQYSLIDNSMTLLAFIGVALPNFWFALMLIWLFAVELGVLPTSQMATPGLEGPWWVHAIDQVKHLILPLVVLTTAQTAGFMRYMRSQVLEVMREDYVNTARSKGLRENRVVNKHIMKNALLPVVTLLGLSLPFLLSGALITEQVFSWPGLGQFFWRAATLRDYPVIMGVLTMISIVALMGNFMADIAYAYLDPRIKYD